MESSFDALPMEVLGVILKNLSKTDFLNSRLVCRSWNKEALTQLIKSKFRLKLNETNVQDFIAFAKQSPSQLPLPLYLIYNFTESGDEDTEPEGLELEMKQFGVTIESLQNIFGPKCILGLDLCFPYASEKTLRVLIEILAELSPVLKTLVLRSFKIRGQIDMGTLKINLKSMTFPNLRNLYLRGVRLMNPGHGREAQILICTHLIGSNQNFNLSILSLPRAMTREELLRINPDQIKWVNTLFVKDRNLVDLLSNNVNILPMLRKLDISVYLGHDDLSPRFLEALSSISTRLTTLVIKFPLGNPRSNCHFPTFPSLKEFQIYSRVNNMPNFINPEVFPALSSIDISVCLFHWVHRKFDSNNFPNQPMPTVQHLTLTLEGPSMLLLLVDPHLKNQTFKEYLQLYHTLFPNAVKLTLVNRKTQEILIKLMLRELVQSECARKFNEIEMKDFDENYLGEILNQLVHPPRLVLENVARSALLEIKLAKIFKDLAAVGLEVSTTFGLNGTNGNCSTIFQGMANQSAETENQLKMTNIKKVTLRLSAQGKENCTFVKLHYLNKEIRNTDYKDNGRKLLDETLVPLNLTSLAQNLSNLEEIYISSRLVATSEHPDKEIQ